MFKEHQGWVLWYNTRIFSAVPLGGEIWSDIFLKFPMLDAHASNEGKGWITHYYMSVETCCTHETNTLTTNERMANEKEHKAVRRLLDG